MSCKKEYTEISIARGIGIIAVVLFHSILTDISIMSYIKEICRGFAMPLFFFLSGFVAIKILKITSVLSYIKFVTNKAKRLLSPYIILGLLLFIPKLLLNKYATVTVIPSKFISDLLLYGNNPITFLWFLYVLFMIFLIYSYFLRKNLTLLLILNFTLYCFLSINKINISLFKISEVVYYSNYFILGLICRLKYDNIIIKLNKKHLVMIALSSTAILLALIQLNSSLFILVFIKGLFGIISILSISNLIINTKLGNILNIVGIYSYDIYLLSWFGQNIPRLLLGQILGMNIIIVFITMLIGGLFMGIVSKYFFRKIFLFNKYILGNFK